MNVADPGWLIVVDVGNRHAKLAQLSSYETEALPPGLAVLRLSSAQPDFEPLSDWLPKARAAWCVASVNRRVESSLAQWVADHRPADDYLRLANDQLPIEIRVDNPAQVGTDRLLAAMGTAGLRTRDRAAIVIDAGSAITVDLVSADGAFQGGAILPGFELMASALAQQTDQLPLISDGDTNDPPPVVGRSTAQAIRSGLFWSHVGAVRELVQRIVTDLDTVPDVFVAGGDAEKLAPYLSSSIVVPHLVFQGIVCAYRHLRGQANGAS